MKIFMHFILRLISLLSPVNPYRARVLVYHSIGRVNASKVSDWVVSEGAFAEQLKYLVGNGYKIIGLRELGVLIKEGISPPAKTICITFDDGLHDNYEIAAPLLDQYDVRASFFVVAGTLHGADICHSGFSSAPGRFMTETELRVLRDASHELGSHSLTHKSFSLLQPEEIFHELYESKKLIAEKLGIGCEVFVCPFGITQNRAAHKATKDSLEKCGYEMAFLGRFGACRTNSQMLDLPRVTIYGGDNINEFRSKVDGKYDWMERPLMLFKVLRYQVKSVFFGEGA